MTYKWQESSSPNPYTFKNRQICYDENGKIVGEIYGETYWHAALHPKQYIGEYISMKHAKAAVEAAL